ncbi:hypothetical protein N7532_004602 [Penicillium argentinense]|uniref:Uncharacterized protein n=1 Tax=Penicillium argentinense TaxID=1131581 RepID=A0A9W9FPS5_9EURO|nr:uncharacterized protein N7532_004602 [Penicillium argentinense]KAJ5104073.1 hypothetical protein N7532_004602 [Penicillium argentinense]
MASTPPPPSPSSLRTPAAPRYGGGYDQYSPYPTRSSARIANQKAARVAKKTPEPVSDCPSSPSKSRSKNGKVDVGAAAPSSSARQPVRNRGVASKQKAPADVPTFTFDDYDLLSHSSPRSRSRPTVSQAALPTPAKTPSKRKLPSSDFSSASRSLFPMQSPARRKKRAPLSLDSFESTAPAEIQIYTDSRDRVPKSITGMDTPFNKKANQHNSGAGSNSRTPKRSRRGGHGGMETESSEPVVNDQHADNHDTDIELDESMDVDAMPRANEKQDSIARAGGMTMIFRGKKIFNDFDDELSDDGEDLGLFASRPDLLQDADFSSVKPLTRNSIKPRRLFAEAKPQPQLPIEEEATDDECHPEAESEALPEGSQSPFTPQSPEFPRAPDGTRNLRSAAGHGSALDATPTASASKSKSDTQRKTASPFFQWLRQKPSPDELTSTGSSPTKRGRRAGSPDARSTKKTRSTRATAQSEAVEEDSLS